MVIGLVSKAFPPASRLQYGLMAGLGLMLVDRVIQEVKQVRSVVAHRCSGSSSDRPGSDSFWLSFPDVAQVAHTGLLKYVTNPWNLLDASIIAVTVVCIALHLGSGADPEASATTRLLAGVQVGHAHSHFLSCRTICSLQPPDCSR